MLRQVITRAIFALSETVGILLQTDAENKYRLQGSRFAGIPPFVLELRVMRVIQDEFSGSFMASAVFVDRDDFSPGVQSYSWVLVYAFEYLCRDEQLFDGRLSFATTGNDRCFI